jgi:hypothetical protein
MALSQLGNAADATVPAAGSPRRWGPSVPQPPVPQPPAPRSADGDDRLLDAIRRGLAPGDPVARLLASWPVPPARAVATSTTRRAPAPLPGPA